MFMNYKCSMFFVDLQIVSKNIFMPSKLIQNITAGNPGPIDWFMGERAQESKPSPAEQLIIDELNFYSVLWYREVSFCRLKFTEKGYPRFDFWIPSVGLLIGV